MSYIRVIPRDLFNESSLLKCYGRLYIFMERTRAGTFPEAVHAFDIVQRDEDGAIFVENLPFCIAGENYRLTRPLNSRRPWPLYAEKIGDPEFEPVEVFDDTGNLTSDMMLLTNRGQPT